jgi:hypothetical protein
MALPPFLLFERGLTDKFPKPSFRFLNNSTGIFPKIEIPHFGGTSADKEVKSSEGIFYGEGLHRGIRKHHYSFSKEIFTLSSFPR